MATRTPRLVGMPITSGHLDAGYASSSRPALAYWLRTIGGHARAYYELLKGTSSTATTPIDGQVPCVPPNARGIYGEDHSGEATGFGRALRHAFYFRSWSTKQLDPSSPGLDHEPPTASVLTGGSTRIKALDRAYMVHVPACYVGGAYEDAQMTIMHRCTAAGTGSNFYVNVWTPAAGGRDAENDSSVEFEFDGTSTGYEYQTETIKLIPGELNRIELSYSALNGSAGTITGRLVCMTIYNDSND